MSTESDIYEGRLLTDGNGNLLADEGSRKGEPVAAHDGSYVFVLAGEPSHNERHHKKFATMEATVDDSMTDDPSLVNANEDENAHHFGPTKSDAHYDKNAPNKTRVRQEPDAVSAKGAGHTAAYTGGDE